jgi:hypothetical protein
MNWTPVHGRLSAHFGDLRGAARLWARTVADRDAKSPHRRRELLKQRAQRIAGSTRRRGPWVRFILAPGACSLRPQRMLQREVGSANRAHTTIGAIRNGHARAPGDGACERRDRNFPKMV